MHKVSFICKCMLTITGQLLGNCDFMETYHIAIIFVNFYGMTYSIPRDWVKGNEREPKESEIKQCLLQTLLQQKQWACKN